MFAEINSSPHVRITNNLIIHTLNTTFAPLTYHRQRHKSRKKTIEAGLYVGCDVDFQSPEMTGHWGMVIMLT
jgi:hypothetical protein